MPKKVILGLVQMSCSAGREENLDKALKNAEECAKAGANIIVLPELFLFHYFCQGKDKKNFDLAETIPGPATEVFGKLAKKYKAVIVLSLFEKAKDGKFYNSNVVLGTSGEVMGIYHKMHIPSLPPEYYAEDFYFERGTEVKVFDTPYGKIAPMICYDQWFPEVARVAAVKGAQILIYPTAIGWTPQQLTSRGMDEYEAWQITQRSHGIDNNVFVAAVNRIGQEKNLKFWGTSFVSDSYGRVLNKASSDKEENIIQEIDLDLIAEMREEWPFLDERQIKIEKCKV